MMCRFDLRVLLGGKNYAATGVLESTDAAGPTPAPAPEPPSVPPLQIFHYGTGWDSEAKYDGKVDLKAAGVDFCIYPIGALDGAGYDKHRGIFGRAPGMFCAVDMTQKDFLMGDWLDRPGRPALYRDCPIINLNDEAQDDAVVRNAKAEELLYAKHALIPTTLLTTSPLRYREAHGAARYDHGHVLDWLNGYPWPATFTGGFPFGAAWARAVDAEYVAQVQLNRQSPAWVRDNPIEHTCPFDLIVRGAMLAAMQQPWYLGFWGWERVHGVRMPLQGDKSGDTASAETALALAIFQAQNVHRLVHGWTRVRPEVVIVLDIPRDGGVYWSPDTSEILYMIADALARWGIRFDVRFKWQLQEAGETPYAVHIGYPNLTINGVKYNRDPSNPRETRGFHPWAAYADYRNVSSPNDIRWEQHQGASEAERVARAIGGLDVVIGLPAMLKSWHTDDHTSPGCTIERFERDGVRKVVAMNTAVAYEGEGTAYVGMARAVGQSVTILGQTFDLGPFDVVEVEET